LTVENDQLREIVKVSFVQKTISKKNIAKTKRSEGT